MLISPKRGEVWRVAFDPAQGAEIQKTRPAVVISGVGIGRLPLRLVVPLTGWSETYASAGWMVRINPTSANGLSKASAADAFQMRGVDLGRFQDKLGVLSDAAVAEIAKAITVAIQFNFR